MHVASIRWTCQLMSIRDHFDINLMTPIYMKNVNIKHSHSSKTMFGLRLLLFLNLFQNAHRACRKVFPGQ